MKLSVWSLILGWKLVEYSRETLKLEDGGECYLDWTIPKNQNQKFNERDPIIIIMHGITGLSKHLQLCIVV